MNAPPKYAPPKYTPPGPVKSIGERAPLVDGPEKVTGRAKYAADYRSPGALVGRILRSPVAHANVIEVDTSAAQALPGVEAVVTGQDCDQTYGVLPIAMNEYPLVRERVRYRGEPVAAVAAVDVETAQKALDLIEFRYEELPAYYTAEKARAPGAVQLHEKKPGNIERHAEFELVGRTRDDAAGEAFDKAARVLGLPYPGGPEIQRVAMDAMGTEEPFTRPRVKGSNDFSYSGLKTAVLYALQEEAPPPKADVAASFHELGFLIMLGSGADHGDVEQVDAIVACNLPAGLIIEKIGRADLIFVVTGKWHRAGADPYPMLARLTV